MLNYVTTEGMAWDPASMSGTNRAEGGTDGAVEFTATMTSQPTGGGANISSSGDIGTKEGKLYFGVNGATVTIQASYNASMSLTGPVFGVLGFQRQKPKPYIHKVNIIEVNGVAITNPNQVLLLNPGTPIQAKVKFKTNQPGQAGAPQPGQPGVVCPHKYRIALQVQDNNNNNALLTEANLTFDPQEGTFTFTIGGYGAGSRIRLEAFFYVGKNNAWHLPKGGRSPEHPIVRY